MTGQSRKYKYGRKGESEMSEEAPLLTISACMESPGNLEVQVNQPFEMLYGLRLAKKPIGGNFANTLQGSHQELHWT